MALAVGLCGAVAMLVGALGPWIVMSSPHLGPLETPMGISGGGVVVMVGLAVLAAAFIVGALLIRDHRAKWSALGAGVCAGLSLLVAVIGIVQVIGSSSAGLSYGFGWGLIVNVLGSMATLAASLLLGRRRTV